MPLRFFPALMLSSTPFGSVCHFDMPPFELFWAASSTEPYSLKCTLISHYVLVLPYRLKRSPSFLPWIVDTNNSVNLQECGSLWISALKLADIGIPESGGWIWAFPVIKTFIKDAVDFLVSRKTICFSTTGALMEVFIKNSSSFNPFTWNLKEPNDRWDLCILINMFEIGSIAHHRKRRKETVGVRGMGYRHTYGNLESLFSIKKKKKKSNFPFCCD